MKIYVRRLAKGEAAYTDEAPAPPRPSAGELSSAYSWWCWELLASGVVKNQAELARRLGVSRARVTQVLSRLR